MKGTKNTVQKKNKKFQAMPNRNKSYSTMVVSNFQKI